MSSPGKKEYNLIFRTRRDAGDFYDWLAGYFTASANSNEVVTIGGYTLKFTGEDLKIEKFDGLSILPFYR